jgi:NAD(P)H dehydrogenase (quinone)
MNLALTGVTGGIGGRVARRLADRGVPMKLVVRDAARAPSDLPATTVAVATYGDGDAMRSALEGSDTLFMVSAAESFNRADEHGTAVAAAADAGVEHLVYLSFVAAAADTTFTFGRDHFHTEEAILASGLKHTFLRDSLYADYIPVFATAEGVIQGPAGDGRASWVARDDIADAAAAVLSDIDAHAGRRYDMTGPEAISVADTAAILGEVSGRSIEYVEETIEEARESRRPSGAPDWEIEGWVTSYAAIANGDLDVVSGDIEVLVGRRPESVRSWLGRHPQSWAHLVNG